MNTTKNSFRLLALLLIVALTALCRPASAATIELAGVQLEDKVTVAGKPLVLNGAGIRYKAIFKVYTAGLYLEKNLYGGGPLIPFVGSSFQFISSNIDVQNLGVEKSASGFGLGLYGGASIFVHPDIALRAQVTFSAATDDVYAEEEDIANTDIRLDIGLSFYF